MRKKNGRCPGEDNGRACMILVLLDQPILAVISTAVEKTRAQPGFLHRHAATTGLRHSAAHAVRCGAFATADDGFHGLTSRPARDRPGRPRRPPDAPAHGPLAHRPPDSPHGLGAFRPPKRPTGRLTQAPRALLGFGRCAGPFSPVHDGRRSDRTYPDCTMAAGGYLHICPLRVRACRKSRFRVSPDRRQAGCKMSFSRGSATTPGDDDRTPPGRGDDKDLGTRHPHSPESTSRSGLNR